jgi:hypothetical protein
LIGSGVILFVHNKNIVWLHYSDNDG